jgi:TolB-like protein
MVNKNTMKKVVKLTESDLTKIIGKIIKEEKEGRPYWADRIEKELYDVISVIDEGNTDLAKRMIEMIVNYMNQHID